VPHKRMARKPRMQSRYHRRAVSVKLLQRMRQLPGTAPKYKSVADTAQKRIYAARTIQRCVQRYWLRCRLVEAARRERVVLNRLAYMDRVASRLQRRYIRLRNERYSAMLLAQTCASLVPSCACVVPNVPLVRSYVSLSLAVHAPGMRQHQRLRPCFEVPCIDGTAYSNGA